jgi:hypothetical protein
MKTNFSFLAVWRRVCSVEGDIVNFFEKYEHHVTRKLKNNLNFKNLNFAKFRKENKNPQIALYFSRSKPNF